MILLDTNIISEMMTAEPNLAVRAWLDAQAAETLYLSSVPLAELLFGIGVLSADKRKNTLSQMLDGLLDLFGDRILPFDTDAARHYAELAVTARAAGENFPTPDGYIAAIAAARRFSVATRNTAPLQAARHTVINPWKAEQ